MIDSGAVLAWGAHDLRDLPWRRERDPWRILAAEVMLQQTQAPRVIPKWTAFLDAFPTPSACAEASLADVLRLWQGLGYPRRARNLHAAAAAVVERHDGRLPDDLDALLALPGIGPYTARAVLAFAFERDVAVVDTNIARI
ncbi:MAG TPA: A/G-specific adenine glycosylase, partial [Ilumatobacteraceae bacterium]|nr:A/G-specific adenine glycosylase [Ilumatobacteraceae bacterium]